MTSHLQTGLLTAAAVLLLVLLGAYGAGSRAARRAADLKQAKDRADTIRKAHEIRQSLDALDDDAMRLRATRWVRGK